MNGFGEVVLQMAHPWSKYLCHQCEKLTMDFMSGHDNSTLVIRELWKMRQGLVKSALVALFYHDPSKLPRVFEIVVKVGFD